MSEKYDATIYLARQVLPQLLGQTINKVILAHDTLGDTFAGLETEQGLRVWVQADLEGNPGGHLHVEPKDQTDPDTILFGTGIEAGS